MKTIKIYITAVAASLVLLLGACKKNEGNILDKRNALPITFSILNVSNAPLEALIDTTKIDIPVGRFDLNNAYPIPDNKNSLKLTITEKETGKVVIEKELNKDDGRAFISFFYMNGEIGKMPELPPVEPDKIKIIYMFRPVKTNYSEPVDIVLGKYYLTPKVFEEITRIKNVKPNEFTEPVTISTFSTAPQPYNGVNSAVSFQVYIYKAGTNTLYVDGTNYTWNPTASTAPRPGAATATSKLYIFSEASTTGYMTFTKNFEL